MSDTNYRFAEAVELLSNPKALKRESGAKRLRKLGIPESGEVLFQALQKELKDKRTWSTQYHLLIALGVVKYEAALPFLWELTRVCGQLRGGIFGDAPP
jgi:HEAT repeat protein